MGAFEAELMRQRYMNEMMSAQASYFRGQPAQYNSFLVKNTISETNEKLLLLEDVE